MCNNHVYMESDLSVEHEFTSEKVNWLAELPDNPSRITFPGRYMHVDKVLSELIAEKLSRGEQLKVLDFASGFLVHGSPIATDLADEIQNNGGKPLIMAVDNYLPEGFSPNDPRIKYSKEITQKEDNLDVVRLFHLKEHIAWEEYQNIKKLVIENLREGGFFITTQYFEEIYGLRDTYGGDKTREFGTMIKIMQKREGRLFLVELVPDAGTGYNFNSLEASDPKNYLEFRKKVASGMTQLDGGTKIELFNMLISRLVNGANVNKIDSWLSDVESLTFVRDNYNTKTLSDDGVKYLEVLEQRKAEAKSYFEHPKKKTIFGWKY